jgi:alpha-mannosidase
MAEQLNITLVPHTHWDREWYQTFQQFRVRLVHVVDALLDILDRDPAFTHFMLDGQTIVLDDYLEVRPEQEERLKRHVHAGRISVGPWYLQPDEFLVSGESLIRNLQIGMSRAASFGGAMCVGYVPDIFGHIAQLPQILRGVGIDNAVFWRGVGSEAHKSEFFWTAPDGSRVLVLHLADPTGYSNARDMPLSPVEFETRSLLLASTLLPQATTTTLLFMNGSDHLAPQDGLPAAIAVANERMAHLSPEHAKVLRGFEPVGQEQPAGQHATFDSVHIRIGSLAGYVAAVSQQLGRAGEDALQTLTGEMRSSQYAHLLPSVLSARMWIKQQNTAAEHLLERWVEPLTAWAALHGAPYPRELALLAWKFLLHNQPHDSICGCSIDQVHRENRVRFDQSQQIGEQLVAEAVQHLVAHIDTRPPAARTSPSTPASHAALPLVVFNPAPGPRTEAVQVDMQLGKLGRRAVVVDEQGVSHPFAVLKRWQQELGTMSFGRELVATTVDLQGPQEPGDFIRLAESTIGSMLGLAAEPGKGFNISDVLINEEGQQPGVVAIDFVLTPVGQADISQASLIEAERRLLALIKREDVTTLDFTVDDRSRASLEFVAAGLPAYGFKTFWLYPDGLPPGAVSPQPSPPAAIENSQPLQTTSTSIENEYYRVEADPADGTLSVTDKQTGAFYAGLNRFVDGGDVGDLYTYCPPARDLLISAPAGAPEIKTHCSPVRSQLRIHSKMSLPAACELDRASRREKRVPCPITSEVTLVPGVRRIEIRTSVENYAKDHILRVTFPVSYTVETVSAEGVFEVRERPAALPRPADVSEWIEEPVNRFPQKRFVDVSNGAQALGILNRGLPEYEVVQDESGGSAVAVTLLRCVEWLSRSDLATRRGHAGPHEFTPEAQCQGASVFDYALVPHSGDWQSEEALVLREAQAFNTPARVIAGDQHAGALPSTASLVEVEPRSLVVSAIKRQHDGQDTRDGKSGGMVVRLYNPLRHAVEARIRPGFAASRAFMANLLEEPQEQLFWGGDEPLHIGMRTGEIVTLLFI